MDTSDKEFKKGDGCYITLQYLEMSMIPDLEMLSHLIMYNTGAGVVRTISIL